MFIKYRLLLLGFVLNSLLITTALSWNSFLRKPVDSDSPIPMCGTPIITAKQKVAIQNTRLLNPELPTQLSKTVARTGFKIGDKHEFYAFDDRDEKYYKVISTCRAATEKTYIFVEDTEWDIGNATQTALDNFIQAFENSTPLTSIDPTTGILMLDTIYFGQPSDVDSDNHITILILDIKDNFDDLGVYIGGYYNSNDQSNNTYSNKMDMIYVDSHPGNPQSEFALATVAHEFQHLIHENIDPNENSWVNEGCSEFAEKLCGYGLRSPLTFLSDPDRSLVIFDYDSKDLIDYAKVALWTNYLVDQFGVDFLRILVAEQANSKDGVTNALATHDYPITCDSVVTNWVIANYLNDLSIANGEYGYKLIGLPKPAVSKTYHTYPVDSPVEFIDNLAAEYVKFTGEDNTARLYFDGKEGSIFRAQLIKFSKNPSVEAIQLNAKNEGQFSLSGLGTEYQELILVPTSLSEQSFYSYSVTTDVEDIYSPHILAGPYESVPTAFGVTIYWETDEYATSIIEYGTDENYGQTVIQSILQVDHQITLSGLTPNTLYHYRVGSIDRFNNGPEYSADFTFTTSALISNDVSTLQEAHSTGYSARNIVRDSNNRIHLVWHEKKVLRRYVYYSHSADDGKSWSIPVKIDSSLFFGGMPALAIDSKDNLHVAWHAQVHSEDDKFMVYYSKSTNKGVDWSTPIILSSALATQDNLYASVAIDTSDNPHIVWTEVLQPDTYQGDIFYTHSFDGGTNWEAPLNLSNSDFRLCFVPTIDFTSKGKAFVFYANTNKLYWTSSSDYVNWESPELINKSGHLYDDMHSCVIDDNDFVHLVYSDNYTPGDIRIMYTYFNTLEWRDPIPIAKSIGAGGIVQYPHIGVDDLSNLYVVYRDNLATSLGKKLGKYIVANKYKSEDVFANTQVGRGDIFLVHKKEKNWSAPGNLSNDGVDSQYPEIGSRVINQALDLIWVAGDSKPFKLNYINFVISSDDHIPPKVVSTYPSNNSTDIPFYKKVTQIKVVFSKRILADSLNSSNVIIQSQSNGAISGIISYVESQKEMTFTSNSNFLPNDTILVTLKASIVDMAGNSLDGDQDGVAESSPIDDYEWKFMTADSDKVSPSFTIGVLQNPVLTQYMDMYVISSEYLADTPKMLVEDQAVILKEINEDLHIYKGDYKITAFGSLNILVEGNDLASNHGSATKSFVAEYIAAKQGGLVKFAENVCQLHIPSGALAKDEYVTIVLNQPNNALARLGKDFTDYETDELDLLDPIITIGHSNLHFDAPARLRIYLVPEYKFDKNHKNFDIYYFDQKWIRMETLFTNSADFIEVDIWKAGNYRLGYTEELIPQNYELAQNYPNPFNPRTTIKYQVPENSLVRIKIYNMLGQEVKKLISEFQEPGFYEISWDGTNEMGLDVTSGIYLYQISTHKFKATKKMLLLR